MNQCNRIKFLKEYNIRDFEQLEKMSNEQVKAVLAFINSLDEIEKSFSTEQDK